MVIRLTASLVALLLVLALVGTSRLTEAAAQADDDTTVEQINAYVDNVMEESRIPGVALTISRDGEIVHSQGYGQTSNSDQPVTPQTPFVIGSTSKSITALAVMQLVEAGLVDLDAPVVRYIPTFALRGTDDTARITVRHLLTMSSGIPADAGGDAFRSTVNKTPEEAVRALRNANLAFDPGSEFEYVNANYAILGLLIETVTGQSYGDYLQQHIFGPLEMPHSYTDPELARQDGFADGHRYWFGRAVAYDTPYLEAMVPAGYVISTAEDLSHYLQMFLNDGVYNGQQIISPAGIAELHKPVHEYPLGTWADGATAHYAMGWLVGGPWGSEPTIFHPGGAPSFTATLHLKPDEGLSVVTLTNSGNYIPLPGATDEMRQVPRGVMNLLMGQEPANTAGLNRFYLYFNAVILLVVAVQIAAFVRLLRRRIAFKTKLNTARLTVPLVWEPGLGALVLWSPNLVDGWRHAWVWTPDLALAILVIGTLWIATGLTRAARITITLNSRHQTRAAHREPLAEPLPAR